MSIPINYKFYEAEAERYKRLYEAQDKLARDRSTTINDQRDEINVLKGIAARQSALMMCMLLRMRDGYKITEDLQGKLSVAIIPEEMEEAARYDGEVHRDDATGTYRINIEPFEE